MTVSFRKHDDRDQTPGIQVFDVDIQPSATTSEGAISLRDYLEKARREDQHNATSDRPTHQGEQQGL